jgi:hypothetical protein
MVTRDSLATDLHRLSNLIECKLSEYLTQLLAEGRHTACTDLCWNGTRFISSLRQIRDGREETEVE